MFTLLYNHIKNIANKPYYDRLHPGAGSHNKLQAASKCISFEQVSTNSA